MLFAILVALLASSCDRNRMRSVPMSKEEQARQAIASVWANDFPLGLLWNNPTLNNKSALENALSQFAGQQVSQLWIKSDLQDLTGTSDLLKLAKANDIKVVINPSWASSLSPTTIPTLQNLWNTLRPKPQAVIIGSILSTASDMVIFARHQNSNTLQRITTIGIAETNAVEMFAKVAKQSAILCTSLHLDTSRTASNRYETFIGNANQAVNAAKIGGMTPLLLLNVDSNVSQPPHFSWQAWAAVASGFKGIIIADKANKPATPPSAFKPLSELRPLLGRLVKHDDYIGFSPIMDMTYPGDITQLFYDPITKKYLIAVVLSPDRPTSTPVTLRGGGVKAIAPSADLASLRPGEGGLYQLPLQGQPVDDLAEANQLTALPRGQRDDLFVPYFGSHFSVLADKSMNPQMLYCSEPVALLVHPNVLLSPLVNATPLVLENSSKIFSFKSAHVSGYTLYRINFTNRFQRLILLEENGSIPGYDLRAISVTNVGVTNNGICPRPKKPGAPTLPANQCNLQYNLDALRAIGGLDPSYPIFFQFDGGNTEGQADTRFYVWAGASVTNAKERVSPRRPVPLILLKAEDKVLTVGMPYIRNAPTTPVLRRWKFFTWVQPQKPARGK